MNDKDSGGEDNLRGKRPLLQRVVGSRGLRIEVDEASAHWFTAPSKQVPASATQRRSVADTSADIDDIDSAIPAFEQRLTLRDSSIDPPGPDRLQNPRTSVPQSSPSTVPRASSLEIPIQPTHSGADLPKPPPEMKGGGSEQLPSHTVV